MAKLEDMTKAQLVEAAKRRAKRSRSGGGGKGGTKLAKTVRKLGKTTNRLLQMNAALNPAITVLTGRNLLNAGGGLKDVQRTTGETLVWRAPTGDRNELGVMIDVWGIATGSVAPGGITPANKGAFIRSAIGYNLRSAFKRGGGPATTFGGAIASSLVGSAAEAGANVAADLVGEFRNLVPRS